MSGSASGGRWVADPSIGWRILLTAAPTTPVHPDVVAARLADLAAAQGWTPAPGPVAIGDDAAGLRETLALPDAAPVVAGVARSGDVVVSAHHAALDGLGLLAALGVLTDARVTSAARGVGDRPHGGGTLATIGRRLTEAALRPPSPVGASPRGPDTPSPGDAMVERTVAGEWRTADLVHAAAQAVVRHEAAAGRTARRVAIAVGAGRPPEPGDERLADRSALIRLRDVERLDRAGVAHALRAAPLQAPPTASVARPWTPLVDRAAGRAMRALAPRLGSTLLVSHLGQVTAPGITALAFHPVTAGGSGLSLGAVELAGRTTLTLRGRAAAWNDNGLEHLLEAVISLL